MTTENKVLEVTVENAIISAFDVEYVKAVMRKNTNIGLASDNHFSSIAEKYLTKQLFTLFLPESLTNLYDWIYENEEVRDLLLSIAQKARYSILANSGFNTRDEWELFLANISTAISFDSSFRNTDQGNISDILMPKQLAMSLFTSNDTIFKILIHNPHFVVLYVILQNFEKTTYYLNMAENAFKDKKKSS